MWSRAPETKGWGFQTVVCSHLLLLKAAYLLPQISFIHPTNAGSIRGLGLGCGEWGIHCQGCISAALDSVFVENFDIFFSIDFFWTNFDILKYCIKNIICFDCWIFFVPSSILHPRPVPHLLHLSPGLGHISLSGTPGGPSLIKWSVLGLR